MEYRLIKKDKLRSLFSAAASEYTVWAPVMGVSEPEFGRISPEKEEEIVLDYQNIKLSPKGIFFPQTETLLTYDYDHVEDVPEIEEKPLVFGSRPCDALALTYFDKIFSAENKGYEDPYYLKRREGSVVVSMACGTPCASCFCSSVGGGPADTKGSDVMVTALDGELLFQAVSEKGKAFMESYAGSFGEAGEARIDAAARQAETAKSEMQEISIDPEAVKKNMDGHFNAAVWNRMTQNCIGCGACTYLCPTCYCFDIADEGRMYKGRRIRTWDSCQYSKFTMHASGHNPRTDKTQRLRQRFMHKFSYTVENTGDIFCVGCGRCIVHCPVNLDIREFIKVFAKN